MPISNLRVRNTMILAGDIGATSARLGAFTLENVRLNLVLDEEYPTREHNDTVEIIRSFITKHRIAVERACMAIAGPVRHGRVEATNLPWIVDAKQIARELNLERVGLINDLEANAYGIFALEGREIAVLNEGASDSCGNMAVISAGTGLGEAGLYWDEKQHHPFACEGGHCDFAPGNDLEIELLRYLQDRFGHVSWERVVSGPGLNSIYEFLRETGRGDEPPWLAEEMRHKDPSSVISRVALNQGNALCMRALELFISLYGAEAGNLALKIMATGGIFLGGGIAPKIMQELKGSVFMRSFTAKGRFKHLLEAIPVRVILNDKAALLGAARYAALKL
ncbi:MAG: glucokinase [Pyrinomonadaceae bacterium]